MATITKPMALDESFNTTESTPRSQADVLAGIEAAIIQGFGRSASDVSYDNTTSGLSADDVQEAVDELAAEKVDKVEGKGLSSNDFTDEDKAALDNMELDIQSTQTATGNPLTLTDCAPINAESLKVELLPKQDLHGQPYPYPGGAYKNKWDFDGYLTACKANNANLSWTESDGVYAINSIGNLYETKYSFAGSDAQITLSIDIKLHNIGETESVWVILLDAQNNEINSTTTALSTDYSHLTVSGTASKVWITYAYGRAVDIKCPQIETGSQATDYAPYENICPIGGYYQAEVNDVGKNEFGGEVLADAICTAEQSAVKDTTNKTVTYQANYIHEKVIFADFKPNTTYTIILSTASANTNLAVVYENGNVSPLNVGANVTSGNTIQSLRGFWEEGTTALKYEESGIFEGVLTAQDYEPYASTSATIQFGQTVYGGEVDFSGGTEDNTKVTVLDGTDAPANSFVRNNTVCGCVLIADQKKYSVTHQTKVMCDKMPVFSPDYVYENDVFGVCENISRDSNGIWVSVCKDMLSSYDITGLQAWLTANNLQVAYERETNVAISTPRTPLKMLKGTNNLSTNGTIITLGYQPDNVIGEVKGEIEKCAVDAEFAQFTDGNDTFTDVNLTLDGYSHTVSMVGSKIEQKRFICFEVAEIRSGSVQGIHASCIAFADGAKTPSGTAFRAYIESLQMYVNFRIYGSGGSYTLAYQSETSFSASAFYVRVRMMNNL